MTALAMRSSSIARVVQHDERALAAHLQADGLQVALGGIFQEIAPTSVEPVKETTSMSGWRPIAWPAVSPKPGSTLSTPAGTPSLGRQLGEAQRGERRLLGRLQHGRAAGSERRRELPGRHEQRESSRAAPGRRRRSAP